MDVCVMTETRLKPVRPLREMSAGLGGPVRASVALEGEHGSEHRGQCCGERAFWAEGIMQ
jgi:hypothetical protein